MTRDPREDKLPRWAQDLLALARRMNALEVSPEARGVVLLALGSGVLPVLGAPIIEEVNARAGTEHDWIARTWTSPRAETAVWPFAEDAA